MTRAIAIANILELDAQIGDLHSDMGLFQGALEDLNNSFFVAPEGWTEEMKAGVDASLEQITALEAKVKAYEGYLKNTIDQELSFRDEVKKLGLSELEYKKYLLGKRVQAYRDAGVDEIALNKFHKDSLAKLEVEAAEKTDKLRERQAEKLISTNLNISKLTDDRYTYEWKALSVKYEKEYALAEGNYDLQLALYQEYVEQKRELDEEEAERKKQSEADVINQVISSYSGVASAYSQMVQGQLTEDINKLKSSAAYENASMEQREIMEQKIRKKHSHAASEAASMEKAANVASSIMNTASAVVEALPNLPLSILVGALGAAQTAMIMATPTGYAKGGLVKGQGSGDTVPAALTPGEFVIKRSAVQTIGLENLFKINNIDSMVQSEGRQSLTKVSNLATDLGGMRRYSRMFDDLQTSATVRSGQEKGRYQYGGLVTMNNSLPMEDMREMTGVGTGNTYNINISAPLVDETVIDSIIPAIEKAQRLNLA
jgi:DNA-binding protein H-NS